MAGSFGHISDDEQDGAFYGIELLDNLGDAYEALEECFGMIWYLAQTPERVQEAWSHWEEGLAIKGKSSKDQNK